MNRVEMTDEKIFSSHLSSSHLSSCSTSVFRNGGEALSRSLGKTRKLRAAHPRPKVPTKGNHQPGSIIHPDRGLFRSGARGFRKENDDGSRSQLADN